MYVLFLARRVFLQKLLHVAPNMVVVCVVLAVTLVPVMVMLPEFFRRMAIRRM